jgi:putative flippase GtrA
MDEAISNQRLVLKIESLLIRRPVILQLLKFVAIGVLNTAIDFIILNFFSKFFGINEGIKLGYLNAFSFFVATIQSYIWNRYWAFEGAVDTGIFRNFIRLVLVGGLGFIAFAAVIVGAGLEFAAGYYLIVLIIFIIGEMLLWKVFRLKQGVSNAGSHSVQFAAFIIVSGIGLLINSSLVSLISRSFPEIVGLNPDLVKNIAKIFATGVSLVWNFIGYKLLVFKK